MNAFRATVLVATAVMMNAACDNADVVGVPPKAVEVPAQQVETILDDHYSGLEEAARIIVRSEQQWRSVWQRLHARHWLKPEPPAIDFDANTVIVAAMGTRRTGGYSIDIEEVSRTDNAAFVVVQETSPGASCIRTMLFTAPAVVVRVPSTVRRVFFVERSSTRDCT